MSHSYKKCTPIWQAAAKIWLGATIGRTLFCIQFVHKHQSKPFEKDLRDDSQPCFGCFCGNDYLAHTTLCHLACAHLPLSVSASPPVVFTWFINPSTYHPRTHRPKSDSRPSRDHVHHPPPCPHPKVNRVTTRLVVLYRSWYYFTFADFPQCIFLASAVHSSVLLSRSCWLLARVVLSLVLIHRSCWFVAWDVWLLLF